MQQPPTLPDDPVDRCPHRQMSVAGTARCQFIQRLIGASGADLAKVHYDLCRACRVCQPPTDDFLPPPLASRLYQVAEQILHQGGVPGCNPTKAQELHDWAEGQLSICMPEGRIATAAAGPTSCAARIGLYGWDTPTGVGTVHRFLAEQLPIKRWIIPQHPAFRSLPGPVEPPYEVCYLDAGQDYSEMLDGLDWLLFCEQPSDASVLSAAKSRGIRLGCVVMWECLDELATWLDQIDLMICPTRYCFEAVSHLRVRRRLNGEMIYLPWTVDGDTYSFRERTICRRFLFVNGHGGGRIWDESPDWDGRKGVRFISEAAALVPEIPILVRSQTDRLPDFPANVEVRIADESNPSSLYEEGDVCVQPSRWEGIGLQLLECQASGLPLITTDGPPMNEFAPFALIPSRKRKRRIYNGRIIPVHEPEVPALADLLQRIYRSDIRAASQQARRQIRDHRSIEAFRRNTLEVLQTYPADA